MNETIYKFIFSSCGMMHGVLELFFFVRQRPLIQLKLIESFESLDSKGMTHTKCSNVPNVRTTLMMNMILHI